MSIEQLLADNTAALTRNSDLLERVIAGQEAAMEKLNAGGGSTRKPRGAKANETPADPVVAESNAGNSTGDAAGSADTASGAEGAAAASEPEVTTQTVADIAGGITTEAQMKEYVTGWTGSTEDADERGARVNLLKAIAGKLGVAPKFADLVPHAAKTVFLIERAKALGTAAVDVEAAYDFDADPAQEAPAAASESDFG
jgi:hypothetical protein